MRRSVAALRPRQSPNDSEAISEAIQRPVMRTLPIKSEGSQTAAGVFWIQELLIRQRTVSDL